MSYLNELELLGWPIKNKRKKKRPFNRDVFKPPHLCGGHRLSDLSRGKRGGVRKGHLRPLIANDVMICLFERLRPHHPHDATSDK
jgi:hypothetical protein